MAAGSTASHRMAAVVQKLEADTFQPMVPLHPETQHRPRKLPNTPTMPTGPDIPKRLMFMRGTMNGWGTTDPIRITTSITLGSTVISPVNLVLTMCGGLLVAALIVSGLAASTSALRPLMLPSVMAGYGIATTSCCMRTQTIRAGISRTT